MVENTQSRPLFSPVTQIMKIQEGILSSRMDYVEDRMPVLKYKGEKFK